MTLVDRLADSEVPSCSTSASDFLIRIRRCGHDRIGFPL